MELIFQCANELMRLVIDRETKYLKVASSKTNYKLVPQEWKMLFDKGKEDMQEAATDVMDDEEFKQSIVRDMKTLGYVLKRG